MMQNSQDVLYRSIGESGTMCAGDYSIGESVTMFEGDYKYREKWYNVCR